MAFNFSAIKEYFGFLDETEDYYEEEEAAYTPKEAPRQYQYASGDTLTKMEAQGSNQLFSRQNVKKEPKHFSEIPREETRSNYREPAKVVAMKNNPAAETPLAKEAKIEAQVIERIVVMEPRVQTECNDIAVRILKNEIVIINFRVMKEPDARRVVDFVNGVLFALNGKFERIGDEIFICTPPNMEVEGAIAKNMVGSNRQRFDLQ